MGDRILPHWYQLVEVTEWLYRDTAQDAYRRRALAMTLFLDRRSARIAEVSAKEKRDASAWLELNNPSRREPGESEGSDAP